jgi:hypothetical protein
LPENHPAEAVGIYQLSLGLSVLDTCFIVDHYPGCWFTVRIVRRKPTPTPPTLPAHAISSQRFEDILANLVAVASSTRRWRRVTLSPRQ